LKVFQADELFAGMIRSLHETSAIIALAAIPPETDHRQHPQRKE
jgi:hypothetical protein